MLDQVRRKSACPAARQLARRRRRAQRLESLFGRGEDVVVEPVGAERHREQLDLALGRRRLGVADVAEDRRRDHRRERGDDRHDDDQLDQREPAARAGRTSAAAAISSARHAAPPPPW
jgi:hypothetical protein